MKVKYSIRKEKNKFEDTYILIKQIEKENSIGCKRIKSGTKKELEKYLKEVL